MAKYKCRTEKQRARVLSAFARRLLHWSRILGVAHWDIKAYATFGEEKSKELGADAEDAATCLPETNYESAQIYLHINSEDDTFNDDELDHYASHEVAHVVLSPITQGALNRVKGTKEEEWFRQAVESCTERLSRALRGCYDKVYRS